MKSKSSTSSVRRGRPLVADVRQGRNEPCACGSGQKFKKCCGNAAAADPVAEVCQELKGSLQLDLIGG